ncbi:MAG: S26 family signal peptidase [Rhodopirellula sp. JB044]|uniref:S26 family signal peptidase n=1 Tax=Rhodopirellula sp. JB044 TaxID=3342844 RepID=UPI00370B9331
MPKRCSRRIWGQRSAGAIAVGALSGTMAMLTDIGCSSSTPPPQRVDERGLNEHGHNERGLHGNRQTFRVGGPSMNPTLWGQSNELVCAHCELTTRVDRGVLTAALHGRVEQVLPASSTVCWHCGAQWDVEYLSTMLAKEAIPPDTFDAVEVDLEKVQCGDLVLIYPHAEPATAQVKRVLARPGQSVSFDSSGRLLVDGDRPQACWRSDVTRPTVPVDIDFHRKRSRWSAAIEKGDSGYIAWVRGEDRSWELTSVEGLLIYEHRNVYRGNRPVRVLDDYPGNLGIDRRLFPAKRLSMSFELNADAPSAGNNEFVVGSESEPLKVDVFTGFWTEEGIQVQHETARLSPGEKVRIHRRCDGVIDRKITQPDVVDEDAMRRRFHQHLSATRPVGVFLAQRLLIARSESERFGYAVSSASKAASLVKSHAILRIRDLRVQRDVEYRGLTPNSRKLPSISTRSPLADATWQMGADEWFVVGDNVPLSIDSRHWGAAQSSEIAGVVTPTR